MGVPSILSDESIPFAERAALTLRWFEIERERSAKFSAAIKALDEEGVDLVEQVDAGAEVVYVDAVRLHRIAMLMWEIDWNSGCQLPARTLPGPFDIVIEGRVTGRRAPLKVIRDTRAR